MTAIVVKIEARLGDDPALLRRLLQHLRDFDAAHFDEMHMDMVVLAPTIPTEQINRIFDSLHPALPVLAQWPRDDSAAQADMRDRHGSV